MEIKVKILSTCQGCDSQAYLTSAKSIDSSGEEYQRYLPCPTCNGSGQTGKWIALSELQKLLNALVCPHEHVSQIGGFHFSAGEVWDDIRDICEDCRYFTAISSAPGAARTPNQLIRRSTIGYIDRIYKGNKFIYPYMYGYFCILSLISIRIITRLQ